MKKLLLLVVFYIIKNKFARKSPAINFILDMAITALLSPVKR